VRLPDWREPEDYAYARDLNPRGWAWEFLRRNDEFRTARAALLEITVGPPPGPADRDAFDKEHARLRAQLDDFGLLASELQAFWPRYFFISYHNPDRTADEMEPLWRGAVRFGNNPSTRSQPFQPGTWAGFPHTIDLTFSFTKPLDVQIEMASRFLKECEQKVRAQSEVRAERPSIKYNPRRFTLYLRLLDGHSNGASIAEMGQVLFGDKGDPIRSARLALRMAQRIVAARYRELLWITSPAQKPKGRRTT
jgi:hypothetical protein